MKRALKLCSLLSISVCAATFLLVTAVAQADQVINDDLIVDGSICTGFDCVNGESFGFDTIRLKENNLRIKFQDTSRGTFPTNDWQITINSSSNGGDSYFAVDDIDGGRTPFKIEAGTPTHSLYVESDGDIGLGTDSPVVNLHIVEGNTPTLRLEQDGSSGFTPQTWDVAGNETNFFVRDVTNGSRLPFKIRPNAYSDTLVIAPSGDIGIGTTSPSEKVEITGSSGDARLLVDENSNTTQGRILVELENNGQPWISFVNSNTSDEFRFGLDSTGHFLVSAPGTGGQEMNLSTDGELQIRSSGTLIFDLQSNGDLDLLGTVGSISSRAYKENITDIDPKDVLSRVEKLPVFIWNYKKDEPSVRHLGPMAEDFREAFMLGDDDLHIAPADEAGVALAAIKGLKQLVDEKDRRIAELAARVEQIEKEKNREIAEISARMEEIERLLAPQVRQAGFPQPAQSY